MHENFVYVYNKSKTCFKKIENTCSCDLYSEVHMSTNEQSVKHGLESMQIQVCQTSDKTNKREHRCESIFLQDDIVIVLGEKEELLWNAEVVQMQMH